MISKRITAFFMRFLLIAVTTTFGESLFGQEYHSLDSALANRKTCTYLGLYLEGNENFPKEIFELENLETLEILGGKINRVPRRIRQLKQLKTINFKMCNIHSFPSWMFTLPELESLSLVDNDIKRIPKNISKFNKLKQLNLRSNPLRKISTGIFELVELERLGIGYPDERPLKMDEKDIKAIQNRLPKCKIER